MATSASGRRRVIRAGKGAAPFFAAVGALWLLAAMTSGVAVGETASTDTREGAGDGRLHVQLGGRFPANFSVAYSGSLTGRQMADKVAQRAGVKVQYLALFHGSAQLVKGQGAGAALTHMDRAPEYRLDAGPNADRTLQELGVMAGDTLKLLLRPLRGDHIHYAFLISYKGSPVDMSMIRDRPHAEHAVRFLP